jgi:hypothetical protein
MKVRAHVKLRGIEPSEQGVTQFPRLRSIIEILRTIKLLLKSGFVGSRLDSTVIWSVGIFILTIRL